MVKIRSPLMLGRIRYKSLAEPRADTTHELGEVRPALVGYIARKTREDIIRLRQPAASVRANDVKFGRKPKLSVREQEIAQQRLAAGESQRAVAQFYRVCASTYRG